MILDVVAALTGIVPRAVDRREDFLATWVFFLTLGYGLIWTALYFAGSSFLTIGFGDIVGSSGPTRFIAVLAGATGLAGVAITTSSLFALFGSFQRRETFVVQIGARAGSPSSGVGLLAIAARGQTIEGLPTLFRAAQAWFHIPPLQWIGDRSLISAPHMRAQALPDFMQGSN